MGNTGQRVLLKVQKDGTWEIEVEKDKEWNESYDWAMWKVSTLCAWLNVNHDHFFQANILLGNHWNIVKPDLTNKDEKFSFLLNVMFILVVFISDVDCYTHAGAFYLVWWCGEVPASCGKRVRPHEVCPSVLFPPPHPPQTWSSEPAPSNAFHGPSPQSAHSAPQTTVDEVKQICKLQNCRYMDLQDWCGGSSKNTLLILHDQVSGNRKNIFKDHIRGYLHILDWTKRVSKWFGKTFCHISKKRVHIFNKGIPGQHEIKPLVFLWHDVKHKAHFCSVV